MSSRAQDAILIALFVALALLPLANSRYLLELAIQVMIFGLFAMSLNVLSGHIGSISFGHAAFFAIGGYACGYFQTALGLPFALSLAGAVMLSGACAFVIGLFCVRLNAIYFSILTLAFSMLVWSVATKWKAVTGGGDGFVGIVVPEFISRPQAFYWFTLSVAAVSVALLWVLTNSTMGRVFIAIRENPIRASFLGVNVRRMQLIAFIIAGTFAGVAGSLMALYMRGMFPESAFWTQSGQVLIMVLLGGMHVFIGPLVGAATLYMLEVFIGQYTQYWQLALGLILLVIVLVSPEGVAGLLGRLALRGKRGDDSRA